MFSTFEAVPETDGDNAVPTEDNNSPIVPLPPHLVGKYPKLPGVLRSYTSTTWRNNKNTWVPFVEYSSKKYYRPNTKENQKGYILKQYIRKHDNWGMLPLI